MKQILISLAFLCSLCCTAQTKTTVVDADSLNSSYKSAKSKIAAISNRLDMWVTKEGTTYYKGHDYVDMGLSVRWATCNIGADKPEAYGLYFAWGDTNGYTSGHVFNWANCIFTNGTDVTMTKYCVSSGTDTEYGTIDGKTTLDLKDDAAHVMWGGSWRMPTHSEQLELADNCYWEWTTDYKGTGVAGYIVYKVKADSDKGVQMNTQGTYEYVHAYDRTDTPVLSGTYSTSDTHIFLPAGGYYQDSLLKAGSECDFWSSTLYQVQSCRAYDMKRNNSKVNTEHSRRFNGQNIRAVCK